MLLSYWTHDIKQNKSCKHVFLLHSHFVSLYFAYALGLHYLCPSVYEYDSISIAHIWAHKESPTRRFTGHQFATEGWQMVFV